MDNLNREQATILCNIVKFDGDTTAVRKCRITKMTKRTPTQDELDWVKAHPHHREAFANYFTTVVDNNYTTRLADQTQVTTNAKILIQFGCTKAQAAEFASREFKSLPKWLRDRIKYSMKPKQQEPRKLKPQPGELAFYVNPHRFPPMQRVQVA